MTWPMRKGDQLEHAVQSIENCILKAVPTLSDKTYQIELRKIITVAGVKHEIDVWVEFDIGGGYKALFIFECKNWEDPVGKNEIIIFSEKIDAARAQRGFFVAKEYTEFARAQAALDPRITLLEATDELPISDIIDRFHHIVIDTSKSRYNVCFLGGGKSALGAKPVDLATAVATLDGAPLEVRGYVMSKGLAIQNDHVNHLPTGTMPNGHYPYDVTVEAPAGAMILNGKEIEKMVFEVHYEVQVVRPVLIAKYEVKTRGRVYVMAPVEVGDQGAIQVKLVETQPHPTN